MKPFLPLLVLLGWFALGLAQTPTPTGTAPTAPGRPTPPVPAKPTAPEAGGVVAPSGDLQDPTKASPALRQAMTPAQPGLPPAVAPRLPLVSLRGRVIARNRPPTAVVEVEGRLYVVGVGSVVAGPGNTVLRVTELTSNDMRIEVAPLNEVIILR